MIAIKSVTVKGDYRQWVTMCSDGISPSVLGATFLLSVLDFRFGERGEAPSIGRGGHQGRELKGTALQLIHRCN